MTTLTWIIGATILVSAGSLFGLLTLLPQEKTLKKILLHLVSLSAGTLMGGAFLHLLPEALMGTSPRPVLTLTLLSFIFFFVIEKALHWRHCHHGTCDNHQFGYLNLVGDAIHNFIDGLIIASTYMVDLRLGMITTLAVASHEIPQEISDFGVLLYSGFTKTQAFCSNVAVALFAVAGGLIGYFLGERAASFSRLLLPAAAGGFLYIAASDLMPEIRRETNRKKSAMAFLMFLIGITFMYVLTLLGIQ